MQPRRRPRERTGACVNGIVGPCAGRSLARALEEEYPHPGVHQSGASARGDGDGYRMAGRRVRIGHDDRCGGTHVDTVRRDAVHDFGAP